MGKVSRSKLIMRTYIVFVVSFMPPNFGPITELPRLEATCTGSFES